MMRPHLLRSGLLCLLILCGPSATAARAIVPPITDPPDNHALIEALKRETAARELAEAEVRTLKQQLREIRQAERAAQRAGRDAARDLRDALSRSDPTVVPQAVHLLHRLLHEDAAIDAAQVAAALDILSTFPVAEAGPDLALLLTQNPPATEPDPRGLRLRDRAVRALAAAASPVVAGDLKAATVDLSLSLRSRCVAAAALIGLDDDAGRVALLTAYRDYLHALTTRNSWDPAPFTVLTECRDWPMIHLIEALLEDHPVGTPHNNINSVLTAMKEHYEPLSTLRKRVADPAWKNAAFRYRAVDILGRMGEPQDVELLLKPVPWDRGQPGDVQQTLIHKKSTEAAQAICRRLWRVRLTELNRRGELGDRPGITVRNDGRPVYPDAFLYAGSTPANPDP